MHRALTWIIAAALVAPPIGAGVVFEIESTEHDGDSQRTVSIEATVEGENIKMDVPERDGGASEMIYRGDRKEMVIIDHDEKSYMVIDQEVIESMGGQIRQAMEAALANVPESQRAAAEKMMKERMGAMSSELPATKIRRTDERAEKAGFPCVKYETLKGDGVVSEMWVTPWDKIDGADDAVAAFESMAGFFEEVIAGFAAAGVPMADAFDNPFEHMKKVGGFPVLTRELADDGSVESEAILRSSRRQRIDPADFEPPAGYARRSMFGN